LVWYTFAYISGKRTASSFKVEGFSTLNTLASRYCSMSINFRMSARCHVSEDGRLLFIFIAMRAPHHLLYVFNKRCTDECNFFFFVDWLTCIVYDWSPTWCTKFLFIYI